jgi:hypothetical protein
MIYYSGKIQLDEILCDQCREEEKWLLSLIKILYLIIIYFRCNNNYGQRLFERFKHQLCYHQDNVYLFSTSKYSLILFNLDKI